MVCHPLPPPLPPWVMLCEAINLIKRDLALYQNLAFNRHFNMAGLGDLLGTLRFTSITPVMLFIDAPEAIDAAYLLRTVEEGWIILNPGRERWKRLGWLDWLDGYSVLDSQFAAGSEPVIRGRNIIANNLKHVFDRGYEWVWGEDGWRYDIPSRISTERLVHLHQLTREYARQ